jgi:hypothetical protein
MENIQSNLLESIKEQLHEKYLPKGAVRLVYHHYAFGSQVQELLQSIGNASRLDTEVVETAQLAAWFYLYGLSEQYDAPETGGIALAKETLSGIGFPSERIDQVTACILPLSGTVPAKTAGSQLLRDAFSVQHFAVKIQQGHAGWRLERELCLREKLTDDQWLQWLLRQMLEVKFFFPYTRIQYETTLTQNIIKIKERLEEKQQYLFSANGNAEMRYYDLPGRNPGRIVQTYYRTNFNNHIHLNAIADNKAHIMISVNAILISVVISIATYRNITQTHPMVLLPVIIFLVTGMASLIFSVLAARPRVTMLNSGVQDFARIKKNLMYFGNFVALNVDQYEQAMEELFRQPHELYANMTRDLYYLGKVLDKKYRFLYYSYNIFLIGFIATVLAFLATLV